MGYAKQTIQADFDRLALLADDHGFDHNVYYHDFLLRHLPARCVNALEVGCGTGRFARALTRRAEHVLAVDLSPQMIQRAQAQYSVSNLKFEIGDVREIELPAEHFDCIVSIATLLAAGSSVAEIETGVTANGCAGGARSLSSGGPG